jgi:hypothetical protein
MSPPSETEKKYLLHSYQIHLFLVEYNRCNHLPSNLPGYKPRNSPAAVGSNGSSSTKSGVPEEILHQQRLLLQVSMLLNFFPSSLMMWAQ